MSPQTRLLARVRRVVLFLAAGLLLYGYARFDVVRLPPGARSPLYGIHAGDRMLVDRHARSGVAEQIWLFRGAQNELLLGRSLGAPPGLPVAQVRALEEGALWLCFERELPDLADSRTLGPIPTDSLAGRVLFVLPW